MVDGVADGMSAEPLVATEPQVATEPVSFIGEDGAFVDGWKNGIDEDLRGEKCLDTFGDLNGAMKMLVHSQKMIGKGKIPQPTEHSTDTEWEEFYKAGGRPDTSGEYKLEISDELSGFFDSATMEKARDVMHKSGLNQAQAAALMAFEEGRVAESIKAAEDASAEEMAKAEQTLRAKYGSSYDERIHLCNKMVEDNTDETTKAAVLEAIGNNPIVIDLFANIATKFVESGVITGTGAPVATPGDIKAQIASLMETTGYANGQLANTSPARHQQVQREITELSKQLFPES